MTDQNLFADFYSINNFNYIRIAGILFPLHGSTEDAIRQDASYINSAVEKLCRDSAANALDSVYYVKQYNKALLSLNVRPWWHNNYQDKDGNDYSLCLGCKNILYWGGERKHKQHCMFIDIDKAVDVLNEESKTT